MYLPRKIQSGLADWRKRIADFWLWDDPDTAISKELAIECIVIGDTTTGDELLFHPKSPDKLYVLPRKSYSAFYVGRDLYEAVEWMCGSGKLVRKFKKREFEPR
jgi:hypothetical protein